MCDTCNHTGIIDTPVEKLGWKYRGKARDQTHVWEDHRHGWRHTKTRNPVVPIPCECKEGKQ